MALKNIEESRSGQQKAKEVEEEEDDEDDDCHVWFTNQRHFQAIKSKGKNWFTTGCEFAKTWHGNKTQKKKKFSEFLIVLINVMHQISQLTDLNAFEKIESCRIGSTNRFFHMSGTPYLLRTGDCR